MSCIADAYMVAIDRACDKVGLTAPHERELLAERFYCGKASTFEHAAIQTELYKVTRADIGRGPLSDTRERVLDVTSERVLDTIEGPVAEDGFEGDKFEEQL